MTLPRVSTLAKSFRPRHVCGSLGLHRAIRLVAAETKPEVKATVFPPLTLPPLPTHLHTYTRHLHPTPYIHTHHSILTSSCACLLPPFISFFLKRWPCAVHTISLCLRELFSVVSWGLLFIYGWQFTCAGSCPHPGDARHSARSEELDKKNI